LLHRVKKIYTKAVVFVLLKLQNREEKVICVNCWPYNHTKSRIRAAMSRSHAKRQLCKKKSRCHWFNIRT